MFDIIYANLYKPAMSFPYDNSAYPFVTSPVQVVPLLRNDISRAVMLREPEWESDLQIIQNGIHFAETPPQDLRHKKLMHNREQTGPMTEERIRREAEMLGVHIDEQALALMTAHCNYLREQFIAYFRELTGDHEREIYGRLFFNPIGGQGIAPLMHVDDREIVLHSTFKGASLSIHTGGDLPEYLWMRMDKNLFEPFMMSEYERRAHLSSLRHSSETYAGEFSHSALGDAVIMRGQRGRNLLDPDVSRTVCVHSSSPNIAREGQAAVAFYPKMV
ncbi:MAG: hypothetical protein JKY71_03390 [Alphaproteobacteria bacterium]|nr:hypothetical protein [Alphaproteobacteria bacterium]